MTFTLQVDRDRWRAHQHTVRDDNPGLVPVTKGNGYGFGNTRLAYEARKLRADILAVGTTDEIADVSDAFDGEILVLTPFRMGEDPVSLPKRVIRTVSTVDGVIALPGRRVVVECLSGLRRHGLVEDDLPKLRTAVDDVDLAGFALHLPLDRPPGVDPPAEVSSWIERLRDGGLPVSTFFVSHLRPTELRSLAERYPDIAFRPRLGTQLWLGDRKAFRALGTVLDVLRVSRGDRYGYRQRRVLSDGHLVVVGGGTSHGVGLEAPKTVRGMGPRAKGLAVASLASVNMTLSPFWWAGKQRWFAEPPHMQVSQLFLPSSISPPVIGDELEVDVRMTITHFDRVVDR